MGAVVKTIVEELRQVALQGNGTRVVSVRLTPECLALLEALVEQFHPVKRASLLERLIERGLEQTVELLTPGERAEVEKRQRRIEKQGVKQHGKADRPSDLG